MVSRPERSAAAGPRRRVWTVAILAAPILLALALGLAQGDARPIADDWRLVVDFDRHGLRESALEGVQYGLRFRPVPNVAVWLERNLLGLGFDGVRALHLVWVGLGAAMLGFLLRALGASGPRALLGALLLAALPASQEPYGWVSTRPDAMALAFALAGLALAVERVHAGAAVCLLLAFLSKESTWPLVAAPPVLALARPGERRRGDALRAAAAPAAALAAALGLKLAVTGGLIGEGWSASILPWEVRVRGVFSYFRPLLLDPVKTIEPSAAVVAAARAYTALLLGGIALAALATWRRRRSARAPQPAAAAPALEDAAAHGPRWRGALALLVVYGLALSVTGGAPAWTAVSWSRHWYVPSAFLAGAVALAAALPTVALAVPLGLLVLHANLAPFRELSRRTAAVVDRLAVEVPRHERAVRVTDLQRYWKGYSLFEQMNIFYCVRFETGHPMDRPLLTLAKEGHNDAAIDRTDAWWREYMAAQGRDVLDLRWDPERGELVEARPTAE